MKLSRASAVLARSAVRTELRHMERHAAHGDGNALLRTAELRELYKRMYDYLYLCAHCEKTKEMHPCKSNRILPSGGDICDKYQPKE